MTLPIEAMTSLAKEKGAVVFVDGAHVPGVLDIDLGYLSDLGVDFYTGNCHKWYFIISYHIFMSFTPSLSLYILYMKSIKVILSEGGGIFMDS